MFLVKNKDIKKHKGEYLNSVVRTKGITITALTEKAKVHRSTFYNHIKDPILPYEDIVKYGRAMDFDFSPAYPEINYSADTGEAPAITTFEEMEKDRNNWKSKYLELKRQLSELIGKD